MSEQELPRYVNSITFHSDQNLDSEWIIWLIDRPSHSFKVKQPSHVRLESKCIPFIDSPGTATSFQVVFKQQ